MTVSTSVAWKLGLAIALGLAILLSVVLPAPRRAVSGGGLRRLLCCALSCYLIGGVAALTHHAGLAGPISAAGIATCALASWLSRGRDSGDPPRAQPTLPPPDPDGSPELDWAAFEREFREYSRPVALSEPEPARRA
jgi:hypothetical protein